MYNLWRSRSVRYSGVRVDWQNPGCCHAHRPGWIAVGGDTSIQLEEA